MMELTNGSDDEYEKFRQKKRKRKEIEKNIPEHWVLGEKKKLIESAIPHINNNSKKKKSTQQKKKKKKQQTTTTNEIEFLKKKGVNQNKVISISDSTTINDHKELKSRPLDDWLLNYSSSNVNKMSDIESEINNTMCNIIENKKKENKQISTTTTSNTVKIKSGKIKKPLRNKKS